MKNAKHTSLIIGGIIVSLTLIIFVVGIPSGKTGIDYVALLFIIFAELSCFLIPYFLKNTATENTMLMPVLYIYAIVSILFSIIFKSAFENNISAFITIHLVFIGITAICYLLSNKLVVDVEKNEAETITQKAVIDECERVANILYQDNRFAEFKTQLEKIYEEIKYNDHISDYKSGEILSVLNDIYNLETTDDVEPLCKKALQLINERNITVKQLKRGGF